MPQPTLDDVLGEIAGEVARAEALHPPMNSAHEGYGIIDEEFEELKQKDRDVAAMRQEAVEVAAMAIRFILDVCDRGRGGV